MHNRNEKLDQLNIFYCSESVIKLFFKIKLSIYRKSIIVLHFLSFLLMQPFLESVHSELKQRKWSEEQNMIQDMMKKRQTVEVIYQENTNLFISPFYFCIYRGSITLQLFLSVVWVSGERKIGSCFQWILYIYINIK